MGTRAWVAAMAVLMVGIGLAPPASATLAPTGDSVPGGRIAVDSGRNLVFVASAGWFDRQPALWTIDGATNQVVRSVPVEASAADLAVDPGSSQIYLCDYSGSRVLVYSYGGDLLSEIAMNGQAPMKLALDAGLSRLVVLNQASNTVASYDTTTRALVSTVQLPSNSTPMALGVNPVTHRAYVASMPVTYARPGFVSVIDEASGAITDTIAAWTNGYPQGFAIDSTRNRVYVSSYSVAVTVIDGGSNEVLGSYGIGNTGPIVVNERLDRVYISDSGNSYISVFDPPTSTLGPELSVYAGGADLAVNPTTSLVYSGNGLSAVVLHGVPRAEFLTTPPSILASHTAKFSFAAIDRDSTAIRDGVSLTCSLDGAAAATCTSPLKLQHLDDGTHQLIIRTAGPAVDDSPAGYTWLVDTTPPATVFDTADNSVLTPSSAVYGHSSDSGSGLTDVRVTFTDSLGHATTLNVTSQCQLRAARCDWSASAPLAPGTYRVTAVSTDQAGNSETPGPTLSIVNT